MERVTKDTTEATYDTEISNISAFSDALKNSANQSFIPALDTVDTNLTDAGSLIAGWAADDVQVKLDDFLTDELVPGVNAIRTDLTGGSFNGMASTAKQLETDLANCKTAKKDWEDAKTAANTAKTTYDNTKSTIEGETHGNYTQSDKPNPKKKENKEKWEAAVATAGTKEKTLEGYLKTANSNFDALKTYAFSLTGEGNSGGGEEASAPAPTSSPEPKQQSEEARAFLEAATHYTTYHTATAFHRNPTTGEVYGEPYEVLVETEVTYVHNEDGTYRVVVNEFTRDSQGNKVGYDGKMPMPGELTQDKIDYNDYADIRMVTTEINGETVTFPFAYKKGTNEALLFPPSFLDGTY